MKKLIKGTAFIVVLALMVLNSTAGNVVIKKTTVSPKLDGKLSETCWQQATKIPLRYYINGKVSANSKVAWCYDDKNIYAGFWLEEPLISKIVAPKVGLNAPEIWNGEVLEWFINVNSDADAYFQFAWNPAGSRFNSRFSAPGVAVHDKSWHPAWKASSSIGKKVWTSEAVIPFAELGVKEPKAGASWSMNLTRTRKTGGIKNDWSSVVKMPNGFHKPSNFPIVWFNKENKPSLKVDKNSKIRALIGMYGVAQGYDRFFDVRKNLKRALKTNNVDIRTMSLGHGGKNGVLHGWPRRYHELLKYDIIALVNIPGGVFTDKQIDNLVDYVSAGGKVIVGGRMFGTWVHKRNKPLWRDTAFGKLLPIKIKDKLAPMGVAKINTSNKQKLFAGIDLNNPNLNVYARMDKLADGATELVSMTLTDKKGKNITSPFIAEKKYGKGSVLQLNLECGHLGGNIPIKELKKGLFNDSSYYPLFWDNIIKYLVNKTIPNPVVLSKEKKFKGYLLFQFDILVDNFVNIFRPEAKIILRPIVKVKKFPYKIEINLKPADKRLAETIFNLGSFTIDDNEQMLHLQLPNLESGGYKIEAVLKKYGKNIAEFSDKIYISKNTETPDDFRIGVCLPPALEVDQVSRIARDLKYAGFSSVHWLGGQLINFGYDGTYRLFNRGRFTSMMQREGFTTEPVWYGMVYDLRYNRARPFKLSTGKKIKIPEWSYPEEDFLRWQYNWLNIFSEKLYGQAPLTDGFFIGDEMVVRNSGNAEKGFEELNNVKITDANRRKLYYAFKKYHLEIAENPVLFSRKISQSYNPKLKFISAISPNSLGRHSSAMINPIYAAKALGAVKPDIYHYGEKKLYQKTLSTMAIVWSATNFGKATSFSLYGGQLNNQYYEDFSEQLFCGISAGASRFDIFSYPRASFEKNGSQDKRAAEIRRAASKTGKIIGRTLNHYTRSRARVAMLFPMTAYVYESMGRKFNDDYLEMTGSSSQYIDLAYGTEANFNILRQMVGHVDILFDEQIQSGMLKNYDVISVANCKQVEEATMREVKRFVKKGGLLLLSSDSAQFNEKNKKSNTLYSIAPAKLLDSRKVVTDYSETRMRNPSVRSVGNNLQAKKKSEELFSFPDNKTACVRGKYGRGIVILLGMPLAALKSQAAKGKFKLIEYLLNKESFLISKPLDGEFSAITFNPKHGFGRAFMIFNGNKKYATTEVEAAGDFADKKKYLFDIISGKQIPFSVQNGKLKFSVGVKGLWGRCLVMLRYLPSIIELSTSGNPQSGQKFMIAVRILRKDRQLVQAALPFTLTVKDPDGIIRDDLSGTRVTDEGIFVYSIKWPENAKKGKWKITAKGKLNNLSSQVEFLNK
jgi:hypothetical protein